MDKRDTMIIIVATGKPSSFYGIPKQLLEIRKETLLGRTIRQCDKRGYSPIITTDNDIAGEVIADFFVPGRYDNGICGLTLSTCGLWRERTIILFGDVVYSKDVMDSIIRYEGNMCTFVDSNNLLALCFSNDEVAEYVKNVLSNNVLDRDSFKYASYYVVPSRDYTRLIGTVEEYQNFIEEIVMTNKLDDLRGEND